MSIVQELFTLAAEAITAITAVGIVLTSTVIVDQASAAIVETFGKYSRTLNAGLNFKLPYPISRVRVRENLKLRKLAFVANVNTSDNAFCDLPISLHYRVTDPKKALYELTDYEGQMQSFAENEVRSKGASMQMTELFRSTDGIKTAIMSALEEKIERYGFKIEDVVVKTAVPSNKVRDAFDTVIASTRFLEAAQNQGEAQKIKTIKIAEGDAEAMRLYGEGIADQRVAIAKGSREAVLEMEPTSLTAEQSAVMMLITNGQEAAVKASNNGGTVILTTTSPTTVGADSANLLAMFSALGKPKVPASVTEVAPALAPAPQ